MLLQSHVLAFHANSKTLTSYDTWAQRCFYIDSACVHAYFVALPPDVYAVYERP